MRNREMISLVCGSILSINADVNLIFVCDCVCADGTGISAIKGDTDGVDCVGCDGGVPGMGGSGLMIGTLGPVPV